MSSRRVLGRLALSLATFMGVTSTALAQSTKSETRFEDWVVACDDSAGTKRCIVSQSFAKAGTKEFVLLFIIAKQDDGSLKAVIYAPTEVLLKAGVTVQVEGVAPSTGTYEYCAPQACVAELSFPDAWATAFRSGTEYSVTFQPVALAPATLKGSLKGFTAAFDFFMKQQENGAAGLQQSSGPAGPLQNEGAAVLPPNEGAAVLPPNDGAVGLQQNSGPQPGNGAIGLQQSTGPVGLQPDTGAAGSPPKEGAGATPPDNDAAGLR